MQRTGSRDQALEVGTHLSRGDLSEIIEYHIHDWTPCYICEERRKCQRKVREPVNQFVCVELALKKVRMKLSLSSYLKNQDVYVNFNRNFLIRLLG